MTTKIKLQDGKHYRMRNGREVGPAFLHDEAGPAYADDSVDEYHPMWKLDGKCFFFSDRELNTIHAEYDIVEELPE